MEKESERSYSEDTGRHGRGLTKGRGKGEKGTDLRETSELELTDGRYGSDGGGSKGSWGHLAGVQLGQLVEGDTIHVPTDF